MEADLELGDLIRQVSKELLDSQTERLAQGGQAVFQVSGLDIEVSFIITKSKGLSGGIDLKVIRADGDRHFEEQEVHRIVLHLGAAADRGDQEDLDEFDAVIPVRPRRRS
jgi:hypothetical protein